MSDDQKPLLRVAIEGEGLSPDDVPIRSLVTLLEAANAALEAVAREEGFDLPEMRLTAVRKGSAAYDLSSPSSSAQSVAQRFYSVAKTRGAGSGPEVRRALQRLHDAGRLGSIRLGLNVPLAGATRSPRAIHLAPPLQPEDLGTEEGREVYGRVVGLAVKGHSASIRIRVDDGVTEDFELSDSLEDVAPRFFNRTVRARVVQQTTGGQIEGRVLETIEPWQNDDLVGVLRSVRDEFAAEGAEIDVAAWLAEVDS